MKLNIKNVQRVFKLAIKVLCKPQRLTTGIHRCLIIKRYEGFTGIKNFLTLKSDGAYQQLLLRASAQADTRVAVPPTPEYYPQWYQQCEKLDQSIINKIRKKCQLLTKKPLISIVMPSYNTDSSILKQAIQSVLQQIYGNWQLCIVDDGSTSPKTIALLKKYQAKDKRIKIHFSSTNQGVCIATNKAIDMAEGDYIAFMDHDDLITEDALYLVAKYINNNSHAKLFFSDEDNMMMQGQLIAPVLKPGFNPFLVESCNYICHFSIYQSDFLHDLHGVREQFDGAQDYDLVLRAIEKLTEAEIVHIPYIIYHWRVVTSSLGHQLIAGESGRKALQEHFNRISVNAKVYATLNRHILYRVRYELPTTLPLISILIPTRDKLDLIRRCIASILEKTSYSNYEIIIIDNGSVEPEVKEYLQLINNYHNIQVVNLDIPFNHSILTNNAAKHARGEFLCLLNNDTEVISENWLNEMLGVAMRKNVAAVGAKLLYPNDTIQHAGVLLGLNHLAGHVNVGVKDSEPGYLFSLWVTMNYKAVTAACLFIKRSIFDEVGGFDEQLDSHFNDVDFCLRLIKAGYQHVFTPYAKLYHHESATRGIPQTPKEYEAFAKSATFIKNRHGELVKQDPYFHKKWSRYASIPHLAIPDKSKVELYEL